MQKGITVAWSSAPRDDQKVLAERAIRAVMNGAMAAGIAHGQVELAPEGYPEDMVRVVSSSPVAKADVERWLEVAGVKVARR